MKSSFYFAQAYGEGAYGAGTYSCTAQQQQDGQCTAASTSGNGGNGDLSNTGVAVVGIITLACLLIFAALVIRLWRRPKLAAQKAETSSEEQAAPQQDKPEAQDPRL